MNDSHLYRLVSVEPTDAPDGGTAPWCRYEIASRHARVTGRRAGSRDEVRSYALSCVERLNGRLQDEPHTTDMLRRGRRNTSADSTHGAEAG
jgi:hypothetical protein